MSWATCYSGSNNIHFNKPALMSDGKFLSHWDPDCKANDRLRENLHLQSNYEYRQYLINNGKNIDNKNMLMTQNNCSNSLFPVGSFTKGAKYLFKNLSDNSQPFGYQDSDLKREYLSRQELNSRLKNTMLTQEELLRLKAQ
jgi:hypothetical protein|tara:strand:+ start:167 stop:589 length:423 start_codon:yes stop_codon:yes gene_type:complete